MKPAWILCCSLLPNQALLNKPFNRFQLDHYYVTPVIKYYSKLRQTPATPI